ncbi:MAG: hypothetical protein ACRCUY_09910 [Thermoguttaceae bacterium]
MEQWHLFFQKRLKIEGETAAFRHNHYKAMSEAMSENLLMMSFLVK